MKIIVLFTLYFVFVNANGKCGENCTWTYDPNTKKLTIEGNGTMDTWGGNGNVPWFNFTHFIETAEIKGDFKKISTFTFYRFSQVTSITLPESLEEIPLWVFDDNKLLKELKLPKNIKTVNSENFVRCPLLEKIEIPPENQYLVFENGVLFNKAKTTLIRYLEVNKATTYTIPDNVTTISQEAFKYSSLTEIIMPDSVKYIEYGAFSYCKSLKKIKFSAKLTSISGGILSHCEALEEIEIPNGVKELPDQTFDSCSSLKKVKFSKTVEKVDSLAFRDCESISQIIVDTENEAFVVVDNVLYTKNKTVLVKYPGADDRISFDIPNTVEKIGIKAFIYASKLNTITIPESVKTIDTMAFGYCASLKSIIIPTSVTTLGVEIFSYCDNLVSVVFKQQNETFPKSAFYNCNSIQNVVLASSIKSLINFQSRSSMKTIIYEGTEEPTCPTEALSKSINVYVPNDYKNNTFCNLNVTKQEKVTCSDLTLNKGNQSPKCLCVINAEPNGNDKCKCTNGTTVNTQTNKCVSTCGEYTIEKDKQSEICTCVTNANKDGDNKCKCKTGTTANAQTNKCLLACGDLTKEKGTQQEICNCITNSKKSGSNCVCNDAYSPNESKTQCVFTCDVFTKEKGSQNAQCSCVENAEPDQLGKCKCKANSTGNYESTKCESINKCNLALNGDTLTISNCEIILYTERLELMKNNTVKIIIENGVKEIKKNAFQKFNKLEEITIGKDVVNIENGAFGNCCSELKTIIFKGSKQPTCPTTLFSKLSKLKPIVVRNEYQSSNNKFCGKQVLRTEMNDGTKPNNNNGTFMKMILLMSMILFLIF